MEGKTSFLLASRHDTWKRLRILILAGLLTGLASSNAAAQAYQKTFYVEGVAAAAPIRAGGMTQTWYTPRGTQTILARHRILISTRPVWGIYRHANTKTDRDTFPGGVGFPINNNNVGNAAGGWNPAAITSTDGHFNTSTADIDVDALKAVGPIVKVRNGGNHQLTNSVKALIQGNAIAGKLPHDGVPEAHSADSFAAVQITGAKTWLQTKPGAQPTVKVFNRGAMVGGGWVQNAANPKPRKQGKTRDPVFVTLNDLATGDSLTEIVMSLDLEWKDAEYEYNEDVIALTIPNNIPDAHVGFSFSSVSDWVLNPYTYSAYLDADGFTVEGLLPGISDWTRTVDAISTTWSLALDGTAIFDYAEIRAPDHLVTAFHRYSYDVGEADGTFDIATVAPAPGSLALLALGGMVAARRRRR